MNALGAAVIAVDPNTMVTVTIAYPPPIGPRNFNAISCRYMAVTVQDAGQLKRTIAVEVIHDPGNPVPAGPYLLNTNNAERIVVPAHYVTLVQPCMPAG